MRKSETGKNKLRVNFSNPFRLFLCSTTPVLWRFHQDHDKMRMENLTSETKMKKQELREDEVRDRTEI
jgi:hypothetical protein